MAVLNRDGHKHWQCPRCGTTYDSPIRVVAVTCRNHKGRNTVAMKPRETP